MLACSHSSRFVLERRIALRYPTIRCITLASGDANSSSSSASVDLDTVTGCYFSLSLSLSLSLSQFLMKIQFCSQSFLFQRSRWGRQGRRRIALRYPTIRCRTLVSGDANSSSSSALADPDIVTGHTHTHTHTLSLSQFLMKIQFCSQSFLFQRSRWGRRGRRIALRYPTIRCRTLASGDANSSSSSALVDSDTVIGHYFSLSLSISDENSILLQNFLFQRSRWGKQGRRRCLRR